jgi:hypothetical protein
MPSDVPPPASPPGDSPLAEPRPRAVTWRSVLIGFAAVTLICGFSPYNDWVVANTYLIGNFLPVSVLLIALVLVLVINAPLRRLMPRVALREGELAVVMAITLSACSLPSSGLIRYLPGGIVGIFQNAAERSDYAQLANDAHIPRWLLPTIPHSQELTAQELGTTDIIKYYRQRSPDQTVPWMAWVRPFFTWGIFIGLLWGMMMLICVIVRRQWVENERLAFPLATVWTSLIEAPENGRSVNALFRSRGFWIAAASVFVIHAFNNLHAYWPEVPEIPIGYNQSAMFANDPWRFVSPGLKDQQISFSMVGIAYFVQAKVAFSVWFFFILLNLAQMLLESNQITFSEQMKADQTFGAVLVMTLVMLWVGRHHWWMVIRHMVGRRRSGEDDSRYLPYAAAGWGVVVCFVGIVAWFMAVGVTLIGAIVIPLVLIMVFMMVARVLAEAGLNFVQINWVTYRTWYYPILIPTEPRLTTPTTFFFAGWISQLFHDLRESFAGFFQQGLRVADATAYERSRRWRTGVSLIVVIAIGLIIGYTVSWTSMLYVEYHHGSTLATPSETPLNYYGTDYSIRTQLYDPALTYQAGGPKESRVGLQIGIGATIVALCSVLRLTLAWWPLHPLGFIVLYSWALQKTWLSVFLGWMAKVVIVRMGGAAMLKAGRSVFIGLVVGEAFAAIFWLIVSLILNWAGYEYHIVRLMPQ